MNILDIVLGVILIAAAIQGFVKGFFAEVASVAAIILGVIAAMLFSVYLKDWLTGVVSWQPETLKIISFLIIFISVVVVVHLMANIMEKFVQAVALGIFSRLAGAAFGVVKIAFFLSFFIYLIAQVEKFDVTIIPKEQKKESKLFAPIQKLAPNLLPFLREEAGKAINNGSAPV